jgi:hypothetical protein
MVTAPWPSGNHRRCGILRDFARVAFAQGRVWNVLVRSWADALSLQAAAKLRPGQGAGCQPDHQSPRRRDERRLGPHGPLALGQQLTRRPVTVRTGPHGRPAPSTTSPPSQSPRRREPFRPRAQPHQPAPRTPWLFCARQERSGCRAHIRPLRATQHEEHLPFPPGLGHTTHSVQRCLRANELPRLSGIAGRNRRDAC